MVIIQCQLFPLRIVNTINRNCQIVPNVDIVWRIVHEEIYCSNHVAVEVELERCKSRMSCNDRTAYRLSPVKIDLETSC